MRTGPRCAPLPAARRLEQRAKQIGRRGDLQRLAARRHPEAGEDRTQNSPRPIAGAAGAATAIAAATVRPTIAAWDTRSTTATQHDALLQHNSVVRSAGVAEQRLVPRHKGCTPLLCRMTRKQGSPGCRHGSRAVNLPGVHAAAAAGRVCCCAVINRQRGRKPRASREELPWHRISASSIPTPCTSRRAIRTWWRRPAPAARLHRRPARARQATAIWSAVRATSARRRCRPSRI